MAIELPVMQQAQSKYGSCDISGNYAEFARALGGYGERVTEPGEVGAAIRRGVEKVRDGTPALLEFITAKDHTYSVF
jgi:thiamine pyrophosphate-dependent acetolactate synthase large subunit-like protein